MAHTAESDHQPCMHRSGCCKDEFAVTLLDSVYKAFLDTNRNRKTLWTLERIFTLQKSRGFWYEHLGIPYYADVLVKERADGCFVELKLVNDGYEYSVSNGDRVARYNSDTWVQWRHSRWAELCPNLARIADNFHATQFYYNYEESRVDVIMYPHTVDDVGFTVTFEPGGPDYTMHQPMDYISPLDHSSVEEPCLRA